MSLVTLKEILSESVEGNYAVGAFNFLDDNFMEAIISAAEQENKPVILQIPPFFAEVNDMSFYWPKMLDRARRATTPICLHLDHGPDFETCMKAIHGGASSVMFDGSTLPIEENIRITKEVVKVAHACGVSVEGEIGHVGSPEGELQAAVVDESTYTKPEDAVRFVKETGVDALAVAVGTVHGVYKGDPKIATELLDEIKRQVDVPLVLHGGSGLPDEQFKAAVKHGINKVNFFTGMSLAATQAIEKRLDETNGNVHYIELKDAAYEAVVDTVTSKMKVFGTKPLKKEYRN